MKKLLLIIGMLSVSGLFFYQSFQNLEVMEMGFNLESFSIDHAKNHPSLSWNISNSSNLKSLEVLRSLDGKNWDTLQTVNSKADLRSNYVYTDKAEFSKNTSYLYYQLKFVDRDLNVEYSEVILTQPQIPHQASVVNTANLAGSLVP